MAGNPNEKIKELYDLIISGDEDNKAIDVAKEALKTGANPLVVIEQGVTQAMRVVGQKFECLEIFLPEMIRSAEVAQGILEVIKPFLVGKGKEEKKETVILGTIQGDIHDIGKNIVRTLLIANGIQVIDLGKDVPGRAFIEAATKNNSRILAISILMSTSLAYAADLLELLRQQELRDHFKVIVGGGCTSQDWANRAGADAYGGSAQDAVRIIKEWQSAF